MKLISATFRFGVLAVLLLVFSGATAQQSILQRRITMDVKNLRLDKTLDVIALQGNFNFSYNAAILRGDSLVSLRAIDQSVQQVLKTLFRDRFVFTEKGNHLILTLPVNKLVAAAPKKKNNTGYLISGYVTDLSTGTRLAYASVYDTASLTATYSDSNGFFKLFLKNAPVSPASIAVSKHDYLDTVIVVEPVNMQQLQIGLSPEPPPVALAVTATPGELPFFEERRWMRYATTYRQRLAARNIHDLTGLRYSQVSFVPGFGTSGALSSTMTYRFSLNVIGGFTGGVDGVEVGSVFNINRNNMRGFQAAGFMNAVGGNMRGMQAAGFMNLNYGKVYGIQAAGFMNLCRDTVTGAQLAGFMNYSNVTTGGFQGAGFLNVSTKSKQTIQAAGFLNVADTALVQAAGFANVARVSGPQVAGFSNTAKDVKGIQTAGFINTAKTVTGAQVAGFINVAKNVKGSQIGFINVADSVSGVSIGFLSFVKNGLHEFEISTNEAVAVNLAFRTGTHHFYNVLTAGVHPVPGQYVLAVGYGVGHRFLFGEKSALDLDLTGYQVYLGSIYQNNTQGRLQLSYSFKPGKHISFFAGASYNVNVFDATVPPDMSFAGQLAPWSTQSFTQNDYKINFWPGFQAGIRLF
jgi:hypothetical protein